MDLNAKKRCLLEALRLHAGQTAYEDDLTLSLIEILFQQCSQSGPRSHCDEIKEAVEKFGVQGLALRLTDILCQREWRVFLKRPRTCWAA